MKHFRFISFKKLSAVDLQKGCNYFDYDPDQCTIDICIMSDGSETCFIDVCGNDNDTGQCLIDFCGMSDSADTSCDIDDCGTDTGCGLDNDGDEHCSLYDYGCPQDQPQQA